MIRRDPIGIVASIAPWNYPLMMMAWKLAPAHRRRQHRGLQALRADAADRAEARRRSSPRSCPRASSTSSLGRGDSVGNALINHPKVDMISITGDVATGKKVLQAAAKSVKRTHLELGGKAPVIVFDDADLDAVVDGLRAFGYYNAGQDCTAACRIYAGDEDLRQARRRPLLGRLDASSYDQPDDTENEIGPLISQAPARPRRQLRRARLAS